MRVTTEVQKKQRIGMKEGGIAWLVDFTEVFWGQKRTEKMYLPPQALG